MIQMGLVQEQGSLQHNAQLDCVLPSFAHRMGD
jgi:hypothetical protein